MSLATLAILGGLGWLFLRGGGLDQLGNDPADRQNYSASADPYRTPGAWSGGSESDYQPASSGVDPNVAASPVAGPTLRLAAFNIQTFGETKSSKSHILEYLADIVRKFDLVAIQEIRSKDEYLIPNFVQLVNRGGRQFDHVIGPRLGYTTSKEQYAYLFDTTRVEVDHQSVYTIGDPDGLLHREPLVATFRARGVHPDEAFTFTLVNVHTDPDEVEEEIDALAEVYRVVRRSSRGEDDIILLGDFNASDRKLGRLGQLPGIYPLIAGVSTNTRQNKQLDNIIVHHPSTSEYTGRSGVFDVMRNYNLSESQALEISDHFPVWAEFSVYERDSQGRIARRGARSGERGARR